jgi:DNA-binding response OmpR family regulator
MNILLVEDEDRVADFVRRGLSGEGFSVTVAPDGETALTQLNASRFDVMVLDLMLPGISGQEVCRTLRERKDSTPVLMLSALDSVDDRIAGLKLGADDYLVKPFDFGELIARIRSLLRRSSAPEPADRESSTISYGDISYDARSLEATSNGRRVALTAKERGLLQLLLSSGGEIVSRERILSVVWGSSENPYTNIVDVYVARLRSKLANSTTEIETIRGIGYRMRTTFTTLQ